MFELLFIACTQRFIKSVLLDSIVKMHLYTCAYLFVCGIVRARFCRVRIYDSAVLSLRNCRVRFCPVTIHMNPLKLEFNLNYILKFSLCLAGNKLHLDHKNQPNNVVYSDSRIEPMYRGHNIEFLALKQVVHIVTNVFQSAK
jgi:hypothetical protein